MRDEGQQVLGWRDVPTDNGALGEWAKSHEPLMRQILIGRGDGLADTMAFYVIAKRAAHEIRHSDEEEGDAFYLCSLSCRTLIYKGMLTPDQVRGYFPDLGDERMQTAIALVHSRFSTNTFPTTARSTPCGATSTG